MFSWKCPIKRLFLRQNKNVARLGLIKESADQEEKFKVDNSPLATHNTPLHFLYLPLAASAGVTERAHEAKRITTRQRRSS